MGEMLELAKTKRLSAIRKFLHTYDTDYKLVFMSSKTLSELLIGKFKIFDELDYFNRKNRNASNSIYLLFKERFNENKKDYDYIIQTIFINE